MRVLLGGLLVALVAAAATAQQTFDSVAREARLALDTGRFEEALALFDRAESLDRRRFAEIRCDKAWALVEAAYVRLRADDYEYADSAFTLAVRLWPAVQGEVLRAWVRARMGYFWQQYRIGKENARADWNAAVAYATDTASLAPGYADAQYALGHAYQRTGRTREAAAHYAAAVGNAAPRNSSLPALRTAAYNASRADSISYSRPISPLFRQSDPGDWQTIDEPDFLIRHHNEPLARRLLETLRYHLSRPVAGGLLEPGAPLAVKCEVFLYRNVGEYVAATKQESWSSGCYRSTMSGGRVTGLTLSLRQDSASLLSTASAHELAHARLASKPWFGSHVPCWVREGFSESAERAYDNYWQTDRLRKGLEAGTLPGLSQVMSADGVTALGDERSFYALSWATVSVLLEHGGSDRFLSFLEALKTDTPEKALFDAYRLKPLDLENLVIQWLRARPGELQPA
jgi:tetratricopeptide (TPR) repeat protein